jgi:tRNA pseudouridine13 synthase
MCHHDGEMPVSPDENLPYDDLRGDMAGAGGLVKDEPGDFEVEEIPAYEPVGEGEHLFLWMERCNRSHEQMTWQISRSLGIPSRDIGVAGIKDRRAVIRQYVSVPASCEPHVARIETEGIRVLRAARHRNKLKRGHLRGNRFSLLVRGVTHEGAARAAVIADRIRRQGFPNYFGSQRFGVAGSTLSLGFDLLSGRQTPRDLPPSRRRFLLSLAISSVQSHLFNACLAARIRDGILRRVLLGDVMLVVESGGRFVVADVDREQSRSDAGETVISGPLFGPDMLPAADEPGRREAHVLASQGLELAAFVPFARLAAGSRRALSVRPEELLVKSVPEGLRVLTTLPSGVYATSLLREIQ